MKILRLLAVPITLAGCTTTATPSQQENSDAEFFPLFDGQSFAGWSGEEGLWRVEGGAIVGETEVALEENTYLIHERQYDNFEVRLKYRMTGDIANTGLQYRSYPMEGKPFMMGGPQANIVTKHADRTFAMLFDELGRDMMVAYGENARIVADLEAELGFRSIVHDCVNTKAAIMAAQRPYPAWNDLTVIAYGDYQLHVLNGVVALQVVDDDPRAPTSGQFGLQIHRDLVMGAEFRNIEVRILDQAPDLTGRFLTDPQPVNQDGECP